MSGADQLDREALDAGFVCVGALRGAHGVKGLTKVASFTETPGTLFEFDAVFLGQNFKPIKLWFKSSSGDFFLAAADLINNREDAQALKGERLFVRRDQLAALGSAEQNDQDDDGDDFYHADLIGLDAKDKDGKALGSIRSVEDFGAGDLLEVSLMEPIKGLGRIVFVPFTKALVPTVDINEGFVTVDLEAWQKDQLSGEPDK